MKLLLISIVMLLSPLSLASDFNLLIGQWSKHSNSQKDYNEVHDLLGIEYNNFGISKFQNSYDRTSYIAGHRSYYVKSKILDISVVLGVVKGYTNIRYLPVILPGVTLKIPDFPIQLDITYIPLVATTAGFRIEF